MFSQDVGPPKRQEPAAFAETVMCFPSYSEASIYSCNDWVNKAKKHKIPVGRLEHYCGRLEKSVGFNKIVGVGVKTKPTSEEPFPYIRLDMDLTGKGIHFNAVQYGDMSQKLAAVITPTVGMPENKMKALYLDYLKALENRSPQFIWEWWLTGEAGLCEESDSSDE